MTLEVNEYIFQEEMKRQVLYDPIKLRGFVPEKGSEVYIWDIPLTATIYKLLDFFEQVGKVFQIKLMGERSPDLTSYYNRGYAFVTYYNKASAQEAINTLDKMPFERIFYLKIEQSLDNCRIYLKGIPVQKSKQEIWSELQSCYKDAIIANVIVYKNCIYSELNRGYVFVEFSTHDEAWCFRDTAKNGFYLFGNKIEADWAIPIKVPDEDELAKVNILFLRNLDPFQEYEQYCQFINQFMKKRFIEKIYKNLNYSYIHLRTHEHAQELLNKLRRFYKGTSVEVNFSTPPNRFADKAFRERIIAERRLKSRSSSLSSSPGSTFISDPSASTSTPFLMSSTPIAMPSSSSQNTFREDKRLTLHEQHKDTPFSMSSTFWSCPSSSRNTFGEDRRLTLSEQHKDTPFSMSSTFWSCPSSSRNTFEEDRRLTIYEQHKDTPFSMSSTSSNLLSSSQHISGESIRRRLTLYEEYVDTNLDTLTDSMFANLSIDC